VAREAVRKSLVLLKNENRALPLVRSVDRLLVAGAGANDIGIQCGGWTVEWQGSFGATTPGVTLLAALAQAVGAHTAVEYDAGGRFAPETHAAVGIALVGEHPYSEGEGDRAELSLSVEDLALVARLRRQCDLLITVIYAGRPLWIEEVLEQSDAVVAAWLPGTQAEGIADVLFGSYPFTGKLPQPWPLRTGETRFGVGYGVQTV
jgi:beta-glucosidase